MFGIGEFARHGRVSVRMLRHYDAIGLLRPAHVDEATGYRFYEAGQLSRLNRILALKDLGLTLQQVHAVLDQRLTTEELRGMLKLRHAELRSQIAADTARLTRVESRLRLIEADEQGPDAAAAGAAEVVVKRIPPIRVAELTAIAANYEPESIGPVIQPLYGELLRRLGRAALTADGPAIAYYELSPDTEQVTVHAAVPIAAAPIAAVDNDCEVAIVDLPEVPVAATIVHHGAMDGVPPTHQTLVRWIDANGYRSTGCPRELYLEAPHDDPDRWVTELQEPIDPESTSQEEPL